MFTYSSEEEILSVTLEHSANAVSTAKYQSKIYATMEISGQPVKMQVDSGASCNVMPCKLLPKDTVITKTDQLFQDESGSSGVSQDFPAQPKEQEEIPG